MVIASLNIGDPIFIGDFFGFILALPIGLFLSFWISAVKNHTAVILGSLLGAILGFFIILAWAGTLFFSTPLPGANGTAVFFGAALFCSILALVTGMLVDVLVARRNTSDYRRTQSQE